MTNPDPAARGKGLLLPFICIGIFMVYLDSTIVNVALPEIQHALSTNMTQLQWVIDAYALVVACLLASARGWSDSLLLAAFAFAAVAMTAFVGRELRQEHPMLPMSLSRSPVLVVAGAVNFFGLFGLYGSIFLLTFYLQRVNGLSTTETGVRFLALNVAIMVFSYVASVVAAKFGPKVPILTGSVASVVGLFALGLLGPGSGYSEYWWSMALLGAGVSLVGAPATVALLSSVRPEQAGTASGVCHTFRQVGSVFGVALCGTLLIRHLSDAVPDAVAGTAMDPGMRQEAVSALSHGDLGVIGQLPAQLRGPVRDTVGPIFTEGCGSGSPLPRSAHSSAACSP
ncbi:MFS transporter [Streptomyces sp. NPDC001514]